MNKLNILTLLFLVCTKLSVAQDNAKVTIGTSYPDIEFHQLYYSVDQTGVLKVGRSNKKIILQKIGLDLIPKKFIQYENFPKDFKVEQVILLKGRCYLLYSAPTKKRLNLFAAQIDVTKGELLDGGKEIVSPSDEVDNTLEGSNSFEIVPSSDSSLFAICYKLKSSVTSKSKNGEVNGVWIFDNMLNERWHAELVLPYNERRAKVLDHAIDVQGNIHLALRVIKDESGIERKPGQTTSNYSIELLSYQSATEPPKVTNLDNNGKFLSNFSLDVVNDNLVCSGFYNNNGSRSDAEGIFVANVPPQQTTKIVFHPFSLSFMNESEKSKRQKSNEKLVAKGKPLEIDLSIIGTTPQSDGGILLLAEQHDVVTTHAVGVGAGGVGGGGGGGGHYYSTDYYFNLIVARLLPDGRLAWIRKLSKSSVSTSFDYFLKESTHRFLFVEQQALIEYRLNDTTGEGERKEIIELKPLLKRPHALFTIKLGYPKLLPERNGVILTANLSGDAGTFGETKPYKDQVEVKVITE